MSQTLSEYIVIGIYNSEHCYFNTFFPLPFSLPYHFGNVDLLLKQKNIYVQPHDGMTSIRFKVYDPKNIQFKKLIIFNMYNMLIMIIFKTTLVLQIHLLK